MPDNYRALIDGESVVFETAVDKFNALAKIWEDYNFNRPDFTFSHSAYLSIIGMGVEALPLLSERIEKGGSGWRTAYLAINGRAWEPPCYPTAQPHCKCGHTFGDHNIPTWGDSTCDGCDCFVYET